MGGREKEKDRGRERERAGELGGGGERDREKERELGTVQVSEPLCPLVFPLRRTSSKQGLL